MMLFSYDFIANQLNKNNAEIRQDIETVSYHLNIKEINLEKVVGGFDEHWISVVEGIQAVTENPEVSIELDGFTVLPSIHQYLRLSLSQVTDYKKSLGGYFRLEFSNQKTFSFYHTNKLPISQLNTPLDLSKLTWRSSYPQKALSTRQKVKWLEIESLDALVIRFFDTEPNALILNGVTIQQNREQTLLRHKDMCNQPIELLCFVTNRMRFEDNQIQKKQGFGWADHQVVSSFNPWVWLLAAWLTLLFIFKNSGVQNVYSYILVSLVFLTVLAAHQHWMLDYANYFRWLLVFSFMGLLWFKKGCLLPPKNIALGLLIGTFLAALIMLFFNAKTDFLGFLPAYFLWALIQQILLGPVFSDHLQQQLKTPHWLTACLVGVLFSIIHAPNHMLMLATLVAGISWCLAWLKYQNIYANALSHALLALLFYQVMNEVWLGSARIGVFF